MKRLLILLIFVLLFSGCSPAQPQNSNTTSESNVDNSILTIQFLDVDQGDAALIQCDGKAMLIDGGSKAESQKMYAVLKEKEIDQLEYIVATCLKDEHIGGLAGALNYASSKKTLCGRNDADSEAFKDFKKYADKNGNGLTVVHSGDTYSLGSAEIEILIVEEIKGLVLLKIIHGDNSFLFVPDGFLNEDIVLDDSLQSTVVKVSDHGNSEESAAEFFKSVDCEYAVISSNGESLNKSILDILNFASIQLYRTDLHQDILCTSDGKSIQFEPQRDAEHSLIYKTDDEVKPISTLKPDSTPEPTIIPKPTSTPIPTPNMEQTVSMPTNVSIDELYEANLLTNLVDVHGTVKTVSTYSGTSYINGWFKAGEEYVSLFTVIMEDGRCNYSGWIDGYNFHDNSTRVVMTPFVEQLDGDEIIPGQQDLAGYFMYEENLKYLGKKDENYLFEFDYFTTVYTLTVDMQSLSLKKVEWDTDMGKDFIEYIYGEWIPGLDIVNCWSDGSGLKMVSVYVDMQDGENTVSLYRPFYIPLTWELEVLSAEQEVFTYLDPNYTVSYSYPGDGINYELYVTNSAG